MNSATRSRIEAAALQLGYATSGHAPARVGTVAVAVSDINNPFYAKLLHGVQQQLKAVGVAQVLIDTEESGRTEAQLLASMRGSYDGLILSSSRMSDQLLVDLASEVPLVTINRNAPGVASVLIDTAEGSSQAVEHLVSLGHRSIVYASGPSNSWSNSRRWQAILEAAERLGAEATRIGPFPATLAAGPAVADAVLNTGATACIAFNDLLAIGMLNRLRQRGVEVPKDLSIIGCDDIFGADFCAPPLTTVDSPTEHAGRVAATMLLGLDRALPESVTLPANLVIRDSTGVPRG